MLHDTGLDPAVSRQDKITRVYSQNACLSLEEILELIVSGIIDTHGCPSDVCTEPGRHCLCLPLGRAPGS